MLGMKQREGQCLVLRPKVSMEKMEVSTSSRKYIQGCHGSHCR